MRARALLVVFFLAGSVGPVRGTDPVADLEIHMQIRALRLDGDFEAALELARGLLTSARNDSTAKNFEIVNRGVLVETLETIVALPPEARADILESERLQREFGAAMSGARLKEALAITQRMWALRERHLGEWHHDVATAIYLCGVTQESLGEYDEAERLLLRALEMYIDIVGESSAAVAMVHGGLGNHYEGVGNYEQSVVHFREIVRLYQTYHWENEPQIAGALDDLSDILRKKGDLRTAEVLIRESVAIRERVGKKARLAHGVASLAIVLHAQGEYAAAEPLYHEALRIQGALTEAHPELARTLSNLGDLLLETGRAEEAAVHYRNALEMQRQIYGEEHVAYANSLRDLAGSVAADGRLAEADSLYQVAFATYEVAVGIDHPEVARLHRGRGTIRRDRGELDAAEREFERALAIHRSAVGEAHRDITATLVLLGELDLLRGDAESATGRFLEALAAYEESRGRVGTALQRATFQESPDLHLAVARLEHGDGARAWRSVERYLGRVLADLLLHARGGDGPREALKLEPVRRTLDPETAIVGWIDLELPADDHRVWGWVIRDTGPVRWVRLADDGGADAVGQLRETLELAGSWPFRLLPDRNVGSLARRVHSARFVPLEPELEGVERLVVVSSGAMVGVPLECLQDDDGRNLGDRVVVSYTPSTTIFAWLRENARERSREPALVIGDPPGDRLPSLPAADDEIARVAAAFDDATTLLGDDASEAALVRLASSGDLAGFRTVHVATHALVDAGRPERSALVLSSVGDPDPVESALTGERVHDGLLTIEEIAREWRLDADLVTLSGCGTALGRPVAGEGFYGFSHAFLQVGARSLVLSLWQVDDRATALLMGRFYENLAGARGIDAKAEALREAKSWLRDYESEGQRPFGHPAYWSAFILVGDPS